ncbi:DNA-binding domain of Mlu1-box binding protein MBP1 [Gigaspora margarita]|uniref:DNA-binding domain of Mlu1-box binding protein MBP1 n=1 Tax=Gigaspora margarita TaxID=4874 RepID=A0A8H4A8N7_GIGMA|nr:DNA-binding domain of Mlu1-box binding protein MBP1 [Gigaspora margarita]
MSQHASPISAFTELGATFQETITNEKLSMVVGQRHKPAMTKKRTAKQEDSDEDDGYLNEPVAYRPYPVTNTKIKKTKYSTSLDPRGYIPVYEFTINNQPIMWDRENGYVHFTGIWKALGNNKADIARLVDTHPDLASTIKKVRGGFLKIQGTWMPHDKAYELCRRTCYEVRDELVSLFGPDFPSQVLDPTQPGYGRLTLSDSVPTKKRQRRKPKDVCIDTTPSTNKGKTKTIIKMMASPIDDNTSEFAHDMAHDTRVINDRVADQHLHNTGCQVQDNHRHLVILRKQKRPADDMHLVDSENQAISKRRRHHSPENGSLGDDEDSSSDDGLAPLPPSPLTENDLYEAINATVALQQLSQDDGARPLRKDSTCNAWPRSFIMGNREFQFVGCRYRVVRYW